MHISVTVRQCEITRWMQLMQQTDHTVNIFDNLLCWVCTRIQGPVLLLAQHSSHQPSSGLVSVSSEPGEYSEGRGGWGAHKRQRGREGKEEVVEGVVSMDRWTALSQHMWNHVSSFTAVKLEPNPSLCWPAPLFLYCTPFSLARHTHTHSSAQTSPSSPAHMLKSSPLLSASKTQHPRLLCCCQVLPLADATGESYPSEVGLPGERQAPRYVQPPLMWTQTCEHNLENIIYTVRLCTCLDIYKLW